MRTMAVEQSRFRGIYLEHHTSVLGYCLRRVAFDDAADVAAEVFATAWRKHATMPEGDLVLPWLYAVAARTVANHRRASRRRGDLAAKTRGLPRASVAPAEAVVVQRSENAKVVEAIRTLRATDREILMLSAWEGLSAPQIAVSLGITPMAAEKRLTRAKHRLAGAIERGMERRIP